MKDKLLKLLLIIGIPLSVLGVAIPCYANATLEVVRERNESVLGNIMDSYFGEYTVYAILICFGVTFGLEFLVVLGINRGIFKDKSKILIPVLIVNALTNPILTVVTRVLDYYVEYNNTDSLILLFEINIFIIEIFLYKLLLKTTYKRAVLLSFFANVVSFWIGSAISQGFLSMISDHLFFKALSMG